MIFQLQFTDLISTIPWWLPLVFIGTGVTAHLIHRARNTLGAEFPGWRSELTSPQWIGVGLFGFGVALLGVLGLGIIGRATGATNLRWFYAVMLLLYARAVEGAISLWLFRLLYDEAIRILDSEHSGSRDVGGLVRAGIRLLLRLFRRRALKWFGTAIITLFGGLLFVWLLVSRPSMPILVAFVLTWSLTTGAIALFSTYWVLRKMPGERPVLLQIGIVLAVTGGEMYNIPDSIELVTSPLVGGPLSASLPGTVSVIGYVMGAAIVFIQLNGQLFDAIIENHSTP